MKTNTVFVARLREDEQGTVFSLRFMETTGLNESGDQFVAEMRLEPMKRLVRQMEDAISFVENGHRKARPE